MQCDAAGEKNIHVYLKSTAKTSFTIDLTWGTLQLQNYPSRQLPLKGIYSSSSLECSEHQHYSDQNQEQFIKMLNADISYSRTTENSEYGF